MPDPDAAPPAGRPAAASSPPTAPTRVQPGPPLENGDRLTRHEFERRYVLRPDLKKAQLIEGVVYMPSPVPLVHAEAHAAVQGLLGLYSAFTPRVSAADNATVRLDLDNEPQPDALLRIASDAGGRSRVSDDDYLEGPPELIAEITATSASIDLHDKLRAYRRNHVQEYVVWRTYDQCIDWFELADTAYRLLPTDDGGVIHSRAFPGLRLASRALLNKDLASALAVLQTGIESAEHGQFIAGLNAHT